jgi:riboflavin biosynthesis pyrimidine reductase
VSAHLLPLGAAGPERTAAEIVAALGLDDGLPGAARPVIAAVMIESADGHATIEGRSTALGHPADTALLRELRTAVDAILVGTGTLAAERYANLLDDDQRARRAERGLEPEPVVVTITRSGRVPVDIPLFAEPAARIQVYTEDAGGAVEGRGAQVEVHRFAPGEARPLAALEHLAAARGVRSVLCEGGPTLLRALVAGPCLDHLMLTLAPLLAGGGDAPRILEGEPLAAPMRMRLHEVHRSDQHLFMHYVPGP